VTQGSELPVVVGLGAGAALIVALSIGLAWSIMPQFSATKDNPLGFAARVAFVQNFTHPCLTRASCHDIDVFMMKSISAKPVWFLEYVVCDANHFPPCAKRFVGGAYFAGQVSKPPCQWGMMSVGTVNWQAGDTVHIWAKIAPFSTGETDPSQIDNSNVRWVDLGDSEIFTYNHREFRATDRC
jgi:hypothetical protein